MKLIKLIKLIFWRLQFKKVKFQGDTWMEGRCIKCAAGNPKVECSDYYCPCTLNEQLKRVRTFKWLNKFNMENNISTPQLGIDSVIGSFPMASPEKIFERLVKLYPDNYVWVAKICDEVLDRTGALLGEVRKAARK